MVAPGTKRPPSTAAKRQSCRPVPPTAGDSPTECRQWSCPSQLCLAQGQRSAAQVQCAEAKPPDGQASRPSRNRAAWLLGLGAAGGGGPGMTLSGGGGSGLWAGGGGWGRGGGRRRDGGGERRCVGAGSGGGGEDGGGGRHVTSVIHAGWRSAGGRGWYSVRLPSLRATRVANVPSLMAAVPATTLA